MNIKANNKMSMGNICMYFNLRAILSLLLNIILWCNNND